ncbi:MAG TPA: hypothetical protein VLC09_14285 [Polyangiaceae bacterium]|nr:hypothetical protein [Polyangiaceae bacterium]
MRTLVRSALLAVSGLVIVPAAHAEPLPPVPVERLLPRAAPSPQWDVGLLAGVCGFGREQLWQSTYFCGDAVADLTWFRRRERESGLGLFANVGTMGFVDGRYGLGVVGLTSLGELFTGQLELGGLGVSDGSGLSPGLLGRLGFGLRSLNQRGHYGHSHQLALGVTHVPGDDPRAGTTLTIQLRVDAFWLAMPFGRL